MSAETSLVAHSTQPADLAPLSEHGASPNVVRVSGPLVTLTWVVFLVTAFLLRKVAWKPILKTLELREKSIRKSLDEAAAARADLARVEEQGRRAIAEAESRQREIVEEARRSAADLAERMRRQAEEDATALVDGARRDIRMAAEQARLQLRAESADMAIALAGKLIGESLDASKHEGLVERLAREA
jgi:F-type H+-transporting ATPase subunit b